MSRVWKDVFCSWCRATYSDSLPKDWKKMYIWLNSLIRIDNKPVYWHRTYLSGLVQIGHCYQQKKLMHPNQLARKFHISLFQANQIVSAVLRLSTRAKKGELYFKNRVLVQALSSSQKPTQMVYKKLNSNKAIMLKRLKYWNQKLKIDLEFNAFLVLMGRSLRVISNPRVKEVQIRLLHNAIFFNDRLCLWKIIPSNLCTWCGVEKMSVKHAMFECQCCTVILEWIKERFNDHKKLEYFEFVFNAADDSSTNKVISLYKRYVYNQFFSKSKITLVSFQLYVTRFVRNYLPIKQKNAKKWKRVCQIFRIDTFD